MNSNNFDEMIENEDNSLNVNDLVHGFIDSTTKQGSFIQYIVYNLELHQILLLVVC